MKITICGLWRGDIILENVIDFQSGRCYYEKISGSTYHGKEE